MKYNLAIPKDIELLNEEDKVKQLAKRCLLLMYIWIRYLI